MRTIVSEEDDIGCLLGMIAMIIILAVTFVVYNTIYEDYKIKEVKEWLEKNNHEVVILFIDKHDYKGRRNYYAVAEGKVTKDRKEVSVHPNLPIPGETWVATPDRHCIKLVELKANNGSK